MKNISARILTLLILLVSVGMMTSCNNKSMLKTTVEQVSGTLPKSLDEDGITTWNSVSYDEEANVLTFEYVYNSEYVTEESFAASDADMKAALINYLRQDEMFMKAMKDTKPNIVYILKLSGKDMKKEVKLNFSEL